LARIANIMARCAIPTFRLFRYDSNIKVESWRASSMKKVALVTGASSGIGKTIARELHAAGFQVYAAARRIDRMADLKAEGITPVSLDLTIDDSICACVKEVLNRAGRIDVLVNNAGYGSYGAIEDVPLEEGRRQFDVNLFGMARLIQLVTPTMRAQHSGKIVNISSMGGKIWTKFGGWYHATKYAVEGLSDCLRMELQPFGIDVIVVEPGGIKTDWGIIAANNLKKTSANGAYAQMANAAADGMINNYSGNMLSKPELIAKTVRKAVTKRRPRTRYLIGFGAKPMVWTHKLFGDRVFDWVIKHFS
jgi:NAD(P)-dependent dehydrogenase (short-subunit alcohol dehydrogenase family)